MGYEVRYSQQFNEDLMCLPDSVYERVERSIDIIAEQLGLLRAYDPPYEAAAPPVACWWHYVPGTYKVIYLTIEEATGLMKLLFLGDTREDPLHRFNRMGTGA